MALTTNRILNVKYQVEAGVFFLFALWLCYVKEKNKKKEGTEKSGTDKKVKMEHRWERIE